MKYSLPLIFVTLLGKTVLAGDPPLIDTDPLVPFPKMKVAPTPNFPAHFLEIQRVESVENLDSDGVPKITSCIQEEIEKAQPIQPVFHRSASYNPSSIREKSFSQSSCSGNIRYASTPLPQEDK